MRKPTRNFNLQCWRSARFTHASLKKNTITKMWHITSQWHKEKNENAPLAFTLSNKMNSNYELLQKKQFRPASHQIICIFVVNNKKSHIELWLTTCYIKTLKNSHVYLCAWTFKNLWKSCVCIWKIMSISKKHKQMLVQHKFITLLNIIKSNSWTWFLLKIFKTQKLVNGMKWITMYFEKKTCV